jgi:membrane fusion protein (multidrug efflux system)
MSRHSTSFEVERPLSAEIAKELLAEPNPALNSAAKASIPSAVQSTNRLRRLLMAGAAFAALAGGSWLGWHYWTVGRFEVSTDDAYVQADNTTIAPKISGYVGDVLVGDNETVKAGQVLATVDDRDFRVALDQAKADVAAADAAVATKQALLDSQKSVIDAARATLGVDHANLTFAEQEDKRYASLAATGYGSVQNAQQAASRIAASHAAVARDEAALETAIRQVDVLKAQLAEANAARQRSQAAQDQAELNLSYTRIVSPVDGVVGARTLRVGQYVQAGTQLMAVVPLSAAYIIANYKETQLADVRPGQKVDIEVDTYSGHTFHGHVDSIAPASGQEFALLPPDNATGNFTKVVQRIPVKIALEGASRVELRPGMSVIPTIQTLASTVRPDSTQEITKTADAAHR